MVKIYNKKPNQIRGEIVHCGQQKEQRKERKKFLAERTCVVLGYPIIDVNFWCRATNP